MVLIFSQLMCAIFALLVVSSQSASTTNGKLLKFYPITKQQYRDIIALTKKQPVVSESDISESHRSIADWSSTLQNNWNNLLITYGGIYKNLTIQQNPVQSYPMCVIKTQNPLRLKRSGNDDTNEYAGVAPNVLFSSSYYGTPQHRSSQLPSLGRNYDVAGVEISVQNDGGIVENGLLPLVPSFIGNNVSPVSSGLIENNNSPFQEVIPLVPASAVPAPVAPPPVVPPPVVPVQETSSPIINCVVVQKRPPSALYGYPQPSHPCYGYQAPVSPPYNPCSFPPYPYPGQTSFRSYELPPIDPAVVAQYQRMMAKYYRHLYALYNANADTDVTRNDAYPNHNNDDDDDNDDDSKETSNKKEVQENEKS